MSKVNQELRVGESVVLDTASPGRIEITLQEKSGQRARFTIESRDDVNISYQANQLASKVARSGLTIK
jgi:hypothetical protein